LHNIQTIVCTFVTMKREKETLINGKKIKDLRESKGFSIRKLSQKIGISDTYLKQIENGSTSNISIKIGKNIAETLDVSFFELFEIELPKFPLKEKLENRIKDLEKELSAKKEIITALKQAIDLYKQGYLESKIIYTVGERIRSIAEEEISKNKNINLPELSERIENKMEKELPDIQKRFNEENLE
jgi:transcriptional regulator with XRE-family HTH domain